MYRHFACGGQGSAFGNGADAPYGSFQLLGNMHLHYFLKTAVLQIILIISGVCR